MITIDDFVLATIHILVPFSVYLFYMAAKDANDKRENDLALMVTIFSTLYFILKYNAPAFHDIPMLIINIPLIVSYYKRNNIAIVVSSIVIISYYYVFYSGYLLIFILEYIIYYFIYYFIRDRINFNWFTLIFALIKMALMTGMTLFLLDNLTSEYVLKALFAIIICTVDVVFVMYVLQKAEDILRLHKTAKEINQDKQIRTTLFQITHEIKNPIAVCKGYLDMFDVNNPEHTKKYIPVIKQEINTTLNLLEDYLSLHRVKINKEILDIGLLLSDSVKKHEIFWKENNIKTEINIPEDEIFIDGDYNRLGQVFLNIIKNSGEALEDNPKIEIWTELKNQNIYIYFKDNGVGMAKKDLEKIKEPFFTTKPRGTGLGVPLSYSIVNSHGGKLIYESEMGVYTLVTVILPIIQL